jgi:glycosyltransferase involved in cell wall biosynthesis
MKKELIRTKELSAQTDIKILHVITRLIPGGAADIALTLCRGLKERGFQVSLAGDLEEKLSEEVYKTGVPFYPIPEFKREISPLNDLKALIKLYRLISKGQYQVVHTHTSKAGILGRLAARLACVPAIVHTPHGSIFHPTFFSPPAQWVFTVVEKMAAQWADKIIAICQSEIEDFLNRRIAPGEKYTIIRGAIDPDKFKRTKIDVAKKKRELGLPEDSFTIGMIARLDYEKGHLTALEAFQKVQKEIPKALLLIVGKGGLEGTIREKINHMGLEASVIMTGYRSDIPEITRLLDVSLHPSLWDCSPRAILEAMLCGVPVIATAVGGIPEIVKDGETGLLVPPGDAEALAHSILRLRREEGLRERLTHGVVERVQEFFDTTQIIDKTINLYLGLLTQKGFLRETQHVYAYQD